MYIGYITLDKIQCTLSTTDFTMYTIMSTVVRDIVHYTFDKGHYTLDKVYCTLEKVHCTVGRVHCTLDKIH